MGAVKWMFTFKVSLSSAKSTQQLTQYSGAFVQIRILATKKLPNTALQPIPENSWHF